jgi:hypothetical protein
MHTEDLHTLHPRAQMFHSNPENFRLNPFSVFHADSKMTFSTYNQPCQKSIAALINNLESVQNCFYPTFFTDDNLHANIANTILFSC